MPGSAQYYRPPRRVPPTRTTDEKEPQSKTRDAIIFFVILVVISASLYAGSLYLESLGLRGMALGLQLLSIILIFMTGGVGVSIGISYYIMRSFLKREFSKRFQKMEEEHQARLREMMGYPESTEESDQ